MALTMRDVDEFRKVCFVGLATVGKSTLSDRLAKPEFKFNPSRRETNGLDFNTIKVNADGKGYALQVWDIAGAELRTDNESLGGYLKSANQIVVCFDTKADDMLAQVHNTINVVESLFGNDMPITIIGCKFDEVDPDVDWAKIVTSVQDQFYPGKSIPLFLCSAKNNMIYKLNSDGRLIEAKFNELSIFLAITSSKPTNSYSTVHSRQVDYKSLDPLHINVTDSSRPNRNNRSRTQRFFGRLISCFGTNSGESDETRRLVHNTSSPGARR